MTAVSNTALRERTDDRVVGRGGAQRYFASLEGDADGADARILSAIKLQIAEACLTGESEAVTTQPHALPGLVPLGDCLNMNFKGTTVDQWWGAIVTSIGMMTEMGARPDARCDCRRTDTSADRTRPARYPDSGQAEGAPAWRRQLSRSGTISGAIVGTPHAQGRARSVREQRVGTQHEAPAHCPSASMASLWLASLWRASLWRASPSRG